jgi:hypothetical protein
MATYAQEDIPARTACILTLRVPCPRYHHRQQRNRYPEPLVRGSKTECDKFNDADASYQDRESYKIVVEPMSSVYVHECPPESPAQGKIGNPWLTGGKRAIRCSILDVGSAKSASHAGWRRVSNAKYKKFKDADCNHQHRESHGIVIEPMSRRYSHNRFLCRAATLASKLGTLMSGD